MLVINQKRKYMADLALARIALIIKDDVVGTHQFVFIRDLRSHTRKNIHPARLVAELRATDTLFLVKIYLDDLVHQRIETRLIQNGTFQEHHIMIFMFVAPAAEIRCNTRVDKLVKLFQATRIRKDYLRQRLTVEGAIWI